MMKSKGVNFFLNEKRDDSQLKLAIYQRKITRYYNAKVKKKSFQINDLGLRRAFLSFKEPSVGALGPNWKVPYRMKEEI